MCRLAIRCGLAVVPHTTGMSEREKPRAVLSACAKLHTDLLLKLVRHFQECPPGLQTPRVLSVLASPWVPPQVSTKAEDSKGDFRYSPFRFESTLTVKGIQLL